jgi:WD40 repeat protein
MRSLTLKITLLFFVRFLFFRICSYGQLEIIINKQLENLSFTDNGNNIIGLNMESVTLWDLNGAVIKTYAFPVSPRFFYNKAFGFTKSPDNKYFACIVSRSFRENYLKQNIVLLWNRDITEPIGVFQPTNEWNNIIDVKLSYTSNFIYILYDDQTLQQWYLPSLIKTAEVKLNYEKLRLIGDTRDGKFLLIELEDNSLAKLDVKTGGINSVIYTCEKKLILVNWAMALNGKYISLLLDNGNLVLVDLKNEKKLAEFIVFDKDSKPVFHYPDSTASVLITKGDDNYLKLWDIKKNRLINSYSLKDEILDLSCTPEGNLTVLSKADSKIRLWNYVIGDSRDIKAIKIETKTDKTEIAGITQVPVIDPRIDVIWQAPDRVYSESESKDYRLRLCINSNVDLRRVYITLNNKTFSIDSVFNRNVAQKCTFSIDRIISLNSGINSLGLEVSGAYNTFVKENRLINYFSEKEEKRLALVIGNDSYKYGGTLANPVNDARDIADTLKSLGFEVIYAENADQRTIKTAMDDFGQRLVNYDVALFYYAGHGIQVKGVNYIVPVDANLMNELDVEYDCVEIGRILGKMEVARSSVNIVILDACRDNPFERTWAGRSAQSKGLAFMNAPSGSLIAYSTSPGKTASDGIQRNGLYTGTLLKYMTKPNIQIEEMFKLVREEVEIKSNHQQTPWESTSLKGRFYFIMY